MNTNSMGELIILKNKLQQYKYEIADKQLELELIISDIADAKQELENYKKNINELAKIYHKKKNEN